MIRFGSGRGQELQKPGLGFVGKMNIFDLSSGMRTTKLITDKPHRDGSPPRRNRSDMVKKKPMDTVAVEDNSVPNEHRKSSSKKPSGTPMKILLAQELSREMESKQKPTNVVARLMGLDALPGPQANPTPKRSFLEGYSHNFSSGEFQCHRQVEDDSCRRVSQFNPPSFNHEKEYKDVYEVWQQPSRAGRFKDQPPRKGRIDENLTEKRMALVRQKFSEAKHLSTDERLLQTEEFQEALEVLSSNRDLFVKFLEEPNSLFSKNFCRIQSVLPSQTKHITVLKPSNIIDAKCEAQVRPLYPSAINIDQDMNTSQRNSRSSGFVHYKAENISNPMRIVILKPSPGTPNEMNTTVASLINPPKQAEGRDFNGSSGTEEDVVSREVKEITGQMKQYLSRQQTDEPLSSSALSNGYVGDGSSFNRSGDDFTEEGCCNASDSEAVTPTSRHSWDYNNRYGSPYSNSSFGHTSCSPEPSVIKEAKKRLSERWAMVTSNGIYQEQNQMRRSSSTLGEILSIPKAENEDGSDGLDVSSQRSCGGEQESKTLIGCFSAGGMKVVGCGEDAPSNLARSNSLPVSSSVYENLDMNGVVPGMLTSKTIVPKEVAKSKNGASSLREKLSSFFSGSKKSGRDNHIPSLSVGSDDRLHTKRAESSCKRNDASSESFHDGYSEASMHIYSEKYGGTLSIPNSLNHGEKHASPSAKASRSSETARASEISRYNQDLPSPISVLEAPFEENANNISQHSISAVSGHPQAALSRSPPIGSVSRTLTWDDSPRLGRPLSSSSKLSKVLSKECEEQERLTFVQKLLSSASLVDIEDSNILARWHSLDSPLDPMLLDEFLDRKGEEAKCRERRSNQRLLFDCVNAALLDTGWSALKGSYPHTRACGRAWRDGQKCSLVAEEVWRLVRDLFSSEEKQVAFECENRNAMVEGLVKREIAGSGWAESMRSEVDEFSDEIGREVVDELVKETLADLTGVCFS